MRYRITREIRKQRRNITKTFVAIMAMVSVLSSCDLHRGKSYNILVVNSNMSGYVPYGRYNSSFAQAIKDENVPATIENFYLDCERYDADEEIARLDSVVNSYSKGKKLDAIVVNGDQATYSLLSTRNPLLKKKPIVFGAVRFPNQKLLSEYAQSKNVTGLYDSMDVVKNMEFVRTVCHRGSVITQIDDSYLDRQTVAFVDSQLNAAPYVVNNMHWQHPLGRIRTMPDSVLSISSVSLRHSDRMASQIEVEWRKKDMKGHFYDDMAERKVIGTQNYFFMMSKYSYNFRFLVLKNESGSQITVGMYTNNIFSAIDEMFDLGSENSKIIGGYFTTWETTAAEEAKILRKILVDKVKAGDIPISVPPKDYVVDWNSHTDMMTSKDFLNLPPYVTVRNMPFSVSHRVLYYVLMYGSVSAVIMLFIYIIVLYYREQHKKIVAYHRLKEEQKNMKLAILGSKTYTWGIKNGVAHISNEFFKDMGMKPTKWKMDKNFDFNFILPAYRQKFLDFGELQNQPGQHSMQYEAQMKNGKRLWLEVRSTTVKSNSGGIKILGLLIDITNQKMHEKELDEARKKAIESERLAEEARRLSKEAELKQSFLANMSHEIRTPLNAIVGFSTLIADEGDSLSDEDKTMFIKDINRNTNLLLRLINDVLDLSRIESGKLEFDFKTVRVNTMIDNVYNATRLQMPKHLQYVEKLCTENPEVYVDEGRLQQVLSNFITNAGKFTPEGSVTLGVCFDERTTEVELYVEDTGIGLTPAEQQLVFDRFYKSDKYRQGTGLGLSISKVIVERLNGRIGLKSEKGKGSRFSVTLAACSAKGR